MIRVLLAEDHNIVRNGIRSLVDKQPDITVVAEAANGIEALQLIKNGLTADILLTDLSMPDLDGIGLITELKKVSAYTRVLILSMLDQESNLLQAINAGANGYLLKSVTEDELIFAIRHVAAGNLFVCSELTSKVISRLSSLPKENVSDVKAAVNLSRREVEILLLISEGFTNNEIAEKLFTSRRTVEGHRQNLLEKTGARNTATLIRFAAKNKLID